MRQRDFAAPPLAELRRSGAASWAALQREGAVLGAMLGEKLADHAHGLEGAPVLDFGAGTGAVAHALAGAAGAPSDACDVDEGAMTRLAAALPAVRCTPHGLSPPLPFPDARFAAVYAGAAFTHLPPSHARQWLGEIARVMQEDAVALILVCGPSAVRRRRAACRPGWIALREDDLARNGALYLPLGTRADGAGEFGLTAYSHTHLVETWEPILPIEAIYEDAFADGADLVVLRKRPPRRAVRRRPANDLGQAIRDRIAAPLAALKGAIERRFG